MNVTAHLRPSCARENRVFMRVFASAPTRSWSHDDDLRLGPAVKSRSQADAAKCEKSLNGKILGAVCESLF
jgi:hypothetical protein